MLQITKDRSGGEVDVKLGESFEIELPENRTTGHRWHLRSSGGPVVEPQDDSFQAPARPPGAAGVRRWLFRAVTAGSADLEMEYRRPWEKRAVETFRITVRVTVGS
jgi:inhibitor of cysteine peptidase